jgi:predicted GIY-YIG superfamily endonuclease
MPISNSINDINDISSNKIEEPWIFYIIQNRDCTYAGVSPDPIKRLRKHNSEISGGAKYTTSKGPGWKHICLVSGFQTKIQAMQFEWAVKHVPPRNTGGIIHRLIKLFTVLNKSHWTSKSPLSSSIPLNIEWKIRKPIELSSLTIPNYITEQLIN